MSENNMFLYTVKPRKTIIGLSGSTKVIRTNKSLYLTKEDVFLCLKSATVYRRFANEGFNERVTIDDVDRVHREFYISPEDWEKFQAEEKSANHGTVVIPDESIIESTNNLETTESEILKESEHSESANEIVETEKTSDPIEEKENTDVMVESQNDKDDTEVESDDDLEIDKVEE